MIHPRRRRYQLGPQAWRRTYRETFPEAGFRRSERSGLALWNGYCGAPEAG